MAVKTYSVKKDGQKYLSKNFQVYEFRCKDGSDKVLISEELVNILQQVRDFFGKPVTITSAYRNATYNAKVNGAKNSQHMYGTAADIKVSGVDPLMVARYVEMIMPNSGGIGYYYHDSNFTHVDVRTSKTRWKNGAGSKDVSVKNHGMIYTADIVTALNKRGIMVDTALWSKKLNEEKDAYWLARKAASLTVNKSVHGKLKEIEEIIKALSERHIITNIGLWQKKMKDDINSYCLAQKIANMTA